MHNTRYTACISTISLLKNGKKKREEYKRGRRNGIGAFDGGSSRANEQQPEIDHNFKGENVNKGTGISGGKWCSSKGGYFLLR